jgi:dihydroneopterin aldolase
MDRITLRSMRFEGRLGVSEEERASPQLVEVDVELEGDLADAAASDELADTVDYGPIVAIAQRAVEERSHRLLEALGGDIAGQALAASPRIATVTVRVRKLAVPIDVDMEHAEVVIRRERR